MQQNRPLCIHQLQTHQQLLLQQSSPNSSSSRFNRISTLICSPGSWRRWISPFLLHLVTVLPVEVALLLLWVATMVVVVVVVVVM
jgi:hypothetical protein